MKFIYVSLKIFKLIPSIYLKSIIKMYFLDLIKNSFNNSPLWRNIFFYSNYFKFPPKNYL